MVIPFFSEPHFSHLSNRNRNIYLTRWETEDIKVKSDIVPILQELSLVTEPYEETAYCTVMTGIGTWGGFLA